MIIWKTEYLKYRYFFGTIFCIEILLDILRLVNVLPIVDGIDTVYSFWQMLSWIAMVALILYDFFSFYYLGKDRLLHLLPVAKTKILYMKSIIFGTYMMIYFVMGLIRYLLLLPEEVTNSKIKVAWIYFSSKFVSVVSFLILLMAILVIIKNIKNKVLSACLGAVFLGGMIALHAHKLFECISIAQNVDWTIGIVDGEVGINQYANILPIVFNYIDNDRCLVEDNFNMISVVLNVIETAVAFLLTKVILHIKKFDFVEN